MDIVEVLNETTEIGLKTILSTIPVGGELITQIWDSVKAHSINKRMDEWKSLIENRLKNVEVSLEEIGNNELFASALIRATEIAIKTAENLKKDYLANVVKNTVDADIEESILMIYLDLIDKYTAWHLKILDYFRNPSFFSQLNGLNIVMGSTIEGLRLVYSEIVCREELLSKIVTDLQNDGMLKKGSFLGTTMTKEGILASRTTNLGNEFLAFIR